MRAKFSDAAEKGRELNDPRFKSNPGDRFGLFRFTLPTTGATLRVVVSGEDIWQKEGMSGEPWDHVSVSRIDKIPTWEEMCFVKHLFFDESECVVQYHPPEKNYINEHPNVLHLWKKCGEPFPMPPEMCV